MSDDRLHQLAQQRVAAAMRTELVRAAIAGRDHWTMDGDTARYRHPDHDGQAYINLSAAAPGADLPFHTVIGSNAGAVSPDNTHVHPTAEVAARWVEYCVAEGGHTHRVALPAEFRLDPPILR